MNGEIAWTQKKNIVFAVDQEPFDDSGKWFCFLYPLMTLDGERVEAETADFPNTGRIWWMIGEQKQPFAMPGAIWSGPIEEHPGWAKSKDNPRHNRFQVRKDAIRHGGHDLIELISLPGFEPTPSLIYKSIEVPMTKPPTSIAFLCGKEFVLGPVKTHWDPERMSATFESFIIREFDPNYPVMLLTPLTDFMKHVRVEHFSFEARQLDYAATPMPFELKLTRKAWIQLDALRESSEEWDGLKDNELVNWAVRTFEELQLSRQERRQLNKFLEQAERIHAPSHETVYQRRLRRIQHIADDVKHAQELGPEVAEVLGHSVFKDLVTSHIERLVEERVNKEVLRRSSEIEDTIRDITRQREQLAAAFERQKEEQDKKLQEIALAHEEELTAERDLLAQEVAANEQIKLALEDARRRFSEESDVLFQKWLDVFPMWRSNRSIAVPIEQHLTDGVSLDSTVGGLELPAFLDRSRKDPEGEALSEEQFLEQFSRVVADEGFLFAEDDLRNFHLCIKTGYLTILAGRTGMGKSSLPRLYAKALGCSDEFLHLSVRPDWLDDRDLLGAFNAIARRFEPSPSGFTEHLISAQADFERKRGGIYLICLDEMNLARVEHYFARFLSILEKPARQRLIHLFGSGLVDATDPYAPFREIRLLDNIRFIGTVNIDETAFFFSPKVLDRAEVVVFQDPELATALPEQAAAPSIVRPVSLDTFQTWQRRPSEAESARPFLLEVDRVLRNSRMGFGFRQFDRMLTYIASAQGILEHDKAIDFQLMQVALPHLRRTAPRFMETLETLMETVDPNRFPRSAEMLQRIRESEGEDDFFQLI